jgi:beta-phosphoglucomutase-like phosphatase (HAD superfamily)
LVGGDEVSNAKPAPDIYLKACARLGANPKSSIACEDSPPGIEAASRAGLRPILVPDLITPTDAMRAHAWQVVNSLHEVIPIIRQVAVRDLNSSSRSEAQR